MTQERASKLVEQNLTAIYGYAYDKLYDKSEAEDLSQEIVLEILRSAENLKSDAAFWGFAWKIAENTFRKFIKRRELINQSVSFEGENLIEVLVSYDPDDQTKHDETIYRLRRELSLLGKRHREICISYYVHNKNCSSIAKERNISVEMVKQHLFKARKLLKEGMEMERKLGEKSYDPGIFRLDFWGDWNHYGNICNRRLPGAILLAAYEKSLTLAELSVELGVAVPYLEEEVETLERAGLLESNVKRVQTNIIIRTDKYEKAFANATKDIYPAVAKKVLALVKDLLPKIRTLDFGGKEYEENRLLIGVINIALMQGYKTATNISPVGEAPKLALGGHGWVSGYDNNYVNHHFEGITLGNYNHDKSAYFSAVNYRVMKHIQHYKHVNFVKKMEAMLDAVMENDANEDNDALPWLIENKFISSNGGKLSANFPVFSFSAFDELTELLAPTAEIVADCMIEVSRRAEDALIKTVPAHLKTQCAPIAKIHHRQDVAAFIMEELIGQGELILPEEKTPLCVYGVRK